MAFISSKFQTAFDMKHEQNQSNKSNFGVLMPHNFRKYPEIKTGRI